MVKMALAVPQKNLGFTDNAKLANQMTRVILPPAFFSTAPRTKKHDFSVPRLCRLGLKIPPRISCQDQYTQQYSYVKFEVFLCFIFYLCHQKMGVIPMPGDSVIRSSHWESQHPGDTSTARLQQQLAGSRCAQPPLGVMNSFGMWRSSSTTLDWQSTPWDNFQPSRAVE